MASISNMTKAKFHRGRLRFPQNRLCHIIKNLRQHPHCHHHRGEEKRTPARNYATYTATINLVLRSAPDPNAAPTMNYLIPEGEKVYGWSDENCQWWLGSGRGNIDADNLWCPVWYGNNKGWANDAFLQRPDGIIAGCADNPRRNGCASRNDGTWSMWR